MRTATVKIKGIGSLIQSKRLLDAPGGAKAAEYDIEHWRDKAHTRNGDVYVPGIAMKRAIDETARVIGEKIPGKGNSRWGGVFMTTVMVKGDIVVGKAKDLQEEMILCDSQGKKGGKGGTQVPRVFPRLDTWGGTFEVVLLTDDIPEELVERYITQAGIRNGVGSFRAQNGGQNGRWSVESVKWS